jgi:hypothetical protein
MMSNQRGYPLKMKGELEIQGVADGKEKVA